MKPRIVEIRSENIFLYATRVENLFLSEFMPQAPGDYVKIYLFILMYAQQEIEISKKGTAKVLGVGPETIEKALAFWEEKGAITRRGKVGTEEEEICFINNIETVFGRHGEEPVQTSEEKGFDGRAAVDDGSVKELFLELEEKTGRTISANDMHGIEQLLNELSVPKEVISYAIDYSCSKGKPFIKYIEAVALDWSEKGCRTVDDVSKILEVSAKRRGLHSKIFGELGLFRPPMPAERTMIDKWLDEWRFSEPAILDACRNLAGRRNPSLNAVDEELQEMIRAKGGIRKDGGNRPGAKDQANVSNRVLREYYEHLRDIAKKQQADRIEEACAADPRIRETLNEERRVAIEKMDFGYTEEGNERRRQAEEKLAVLKEKEISLLAENGFPSDYMEVRYKCPICGDRGKTDQGKICECAKARALEAFDWNIERQTAERGQ